MSRSLTLKCMATLGVLAALCSPASAQQGNSRDSQAKKCTPMQEGKEMVREILGYRNRCTQVVSSFGNKSTNGNTVQRSEGGKAVRSGSR